MPPKNPTTAEEFIGKEFGDLRCIDNAFSVNNKRYYRFVCTKCGFVFEAPGSVIRAGERTRCNHNHFKNRYTTTEHKREYRLYMNLVYSVGGKEQLHEDLRTFNQFFSDVGPAPLDCARPNRLYLMLIDKDKGYVPGNFKWSKYCDNTNKSKKGLSYEKADEIREKKKAGALHKDLAAEYGVSSMMISHIVRNNQWVRRDV